MPKIIADKEKGKRTKTMEDKEKEQEEDKMSPHAVVSSFPHENENTE